MPRLIAIVLLAAFSAQGQALLSPDVFVTTRHFSHPADCVEAFWASEGLGRMSSVRLTEAEATLVALQAAETILSAQTLSPRDRYVLAAFFDGHTCLFREKLLAAQSGTPRSLPPDVIDITYIPCLAARVFIRKRAAWVIGFAWERTPTGPDFPQTPSVHGHTSVVVLDAQTGKVLASEACS